MLFSVVIPVYNVERFLGDCLDSVLSQTYADFEAVCVNDGSTDNSLSILEEYKRKDCRIRIINQQNKGLSEARNAGLKEAKGDYVMFLDSDDWIATNALEVLSKHINGQDFIAFNSREVYETGMPTDVSPGIDEPMICGWTYFEKYVLIERRPLFICVFLRLYRRAFLLEHNLWFEKGIFHEDNLFTPIVCYYAERVTSICDVLYFYRIREGSIMTTRNVKKKRDIIVVANSLSSFFEDKQIHSPSFDKYVVSLYIRTFLPDNQMPEIENELKAMIDWRRFWGRCTYWTHKVRYVCLRVSPRLFRLYIMVAKKIRKMQRGWFPKCLKKSYSKRLA